MLAAAGLFQKPWWVVLPHARKRGEKPNRTKTAPKQTEKRGKRAGEKRDNRKLSQRVSVFFRGAGRLEAVTGAARYCPRRCGSNGSRWRGNAVRRRAVSKTVVDDTAPCTEKREKPNRTKTTPKQTEKRGKEAGEKRDNRKLSQRVSVFFPRGRVAWKLPGGCIGCAGAGALPMAGKPWGGKKRRYNPASQPLRENGREKGTAGLLTGGRSGLEPGPGDTVPGKNPGKKSWAGTMGKNPGKESWAGALGRILGRDLGKNPREESSPGALAAASRPRWGKEKERMAGRLPA